MATDFPTKGDDKKISLRNSQYPQFDFEFAKNLKENHPKIWRAGGNIRGNDAYLNWEKARKGQETEAVLDWIKEREAWSARHFRDGRQFKSGGKEPNLSNVAGVVAQIKWGTIGTLGERGMKDVILELTKKLEGRKERDLPEEEYGALVEEERPYPNEHSARLKTASGYDRVRRKNDEFGEGIHAIYGIKEGEPTEVISIRFDKDKFSVAEAQAWLEENDYSPTKFEPASEEAMEHGDEERQVSAKIKKSLENKVEEHNEKYGDSPTKRTNYRTLVAVFDRGVGAYKTNPASVRPGVTGPEQWGLARVNSFLFALRNGRFQGGKHDTDLFPKGHPLSSKERALPDAYGPAPDGEMERCGTCAFYDTEEGYCYKWDDFVNYDFVCAAWKAIGDVDEDELMEEIEEDESVVVGVREEDVTFTRSEVNHRATKDDNISTVFFTTEEIDRHGTIVRTKGIDTKEYMRNPVVLWQHGNDPMRGRLPIAKTETIIEKQVRRGDKMVPGMLARIKWYDDEFSQKVRAMVKDGFLNMASMGWKPTRIDYMEDGDRQIPVFEESEMTEFSIVDIGSNRGSVFEMRDSETGSPTIDLLDRLEKLEALLASKEATTAEAPKPQEPSKEEPVVAPAEPAVDYGSLAKQLASTVLEQDIKDAVEFIQRKYLGVR